MQYLLAYGSLKSTHYNFNRFPGQKVLKKDLVLEGYEMYSLFNGMYPAITEGKGKIKVELHSVTPYAANRIRIMELGSGYVKKCLTVDGVNASLYLMNKEQLKSAPKVENGNWE